MASLPPAAPPAPALTVDEVRTAQERIAGRVHRTPLVRSRTLDDRVGARLLLKAESLQRAGAFKARGAFNAVLAGLERGDRRALIAVSSGNHGQAVALAARELQLAATVVMPQDSSPLKLSATRGYGAEVVSDGIDGRNREEVARELAERGDLHLIHPFDDQDVMAGQGTSALELLEQARSGGASPDAVLVPVGGGGLLAGVATVVRAVSPGTLVIGVEPRRADDAARSLAAGHRVALDAPPDTIADGVRTLQLGVRPWAVIRERVDAIVTVDEMDIVHAMWWLWTRTKLLVEPTGALPLAALLAGRVAVGERGADRAGAAQPRLPAGAVIALLLSGGNVDPRQMATLFAGLPPP
ncbi:MAG TPA: threonine/serine dehydratase [Verrucomicrobiae bacterium]|nr:threonine/serine dehydratase [Verrucomicrobiae bacterium]